jgi:sialic acid synthase SpsE
MEPHELKMLVEETKSAWESLGQVTYGPTEAEKKSLIFRRSIYVSKNMEAGEEISHNNIKVVRPGNGLSPSFLEIIVGKKIKQRVTKGTPFSWDLI